MNSTLLKGMEKGKVTSSQFPGPVFTTFWPFFEVEARARGPGFPTPLH